MKVYNKSNIPLAKELRKNMTPWERKLWYEYLRYYPIRFQRQKAIGDYIVDFYCAKVGLVIELDGGGHCTEEQEIADTLRTARLENMNLRILRICNLDVDRNFRGVCEFIDQQVRNALPQSASLTAPSTEGAGLQTGQEMKIYALGFFDGVHLGHQALLAECVRMASSLDAQSAAITFDRHPQSLFLESPPALINTNADRDALLRRYGIRHIHRLPVTEEVMSTSWEDFLLALLKDGPAGFVCGDDFRFGHKGEGNAQKLQAFCRQRNLPCTIVPEQTVHGIRVSSTHIRRLIEAGDMETAAEFLGHPHILSGTVVTGRRLGHTIGVPTANVLIPEGVTVPRLGVYACRCHIDGKAYTAVTNVGSRPTVGGHQVRTESWILDFEGDLYDKTVYLAFRKFLRPEKKFDSLEELCREIRKNAAEAGKFFEKR